MAARYFISNSAGQLDGKPFAIVDRLDGQGGKGLRRVSFHRTLKAARKAIVKLRAVGTRRPNE